MMLLKRQSLKLIIVLSVTSVLIFSTLRTPYAQEQSKLPAPTTHVNDNAGVIGEPEKQQLENVLGNLQLRSGINFTVVTVKTTGGRDIYDFSHELAGEWDIGARTSPSKSLLLVVSVEEKLFFTQFSKQVANQLPDGVLGEMGQRLRGRINSGRVAEALIEGVQQFVTELSTKLGFSSQGMDQPVVAQASIPEARAPVTTSKPADISSEEAKPAETSARPENSNSPAPDSAANLARSATRKNDASTEPAKTSMPGSRKKNTPADDEAEAEEVEVTLTLPVTARVDALKAFLAAPPDSKSRARAAELLLSARAALGDERLRAGDNAGVEQMLSVIVDSPPDISDKLFSGVVSQIPLNLYMRGERSAALKAANLIETKVANDPKRLLAVSGFYLGIERGDEAARIAELALRLAPDMSAAHHALGLALHISLRLDDAAAEYKRALELDPKTPTARRSLADLNRAFGKSAEALALYREQLAVEPADKGARTGLVLALYELGQTAEADKEFGAALKDDPRNLALLTGAAYWFVAHNDSKRGLELAQRAADIEPRYTWGQIALARALIAEKQPLYAERSLRFVQQYGKFPTLDYELANTLSALGLYEEAAEALTRSFTLKDGSIETQLAGRLAAKSPSFTELLAPERQASIFQFIAADSENNARLLKSLLAFTLATNPQGDNSGIDEAAAVAAAREFASGGDDMRAYRQLYAAGRLLQRGIGFQAAQEIADAARGGVDAAISVPAVTVAVQADELRNIRAQAIAGGGTPDIPDAPRNVLANILRGRIEDLSGWALFNQDKTAEAIERLRRAVGVLPEQTPSWRAAEWRLGTALQQNGNNEEALGYYIKSYNAGFQDSVRRVTIEQLYKKVNGSLEGLDDRIGPTRATAAVAPSAPGAVNASPAAEQVTPDKGIGNQLPAALPAPAPTPTPEPAPVQTSPTSSATPVAKATPTPSSESSRTPEPTATPAPEATPEATPATQPTTTSSPERTATPASEPTPTASPSASPSPAPPSDGRPRRVKPPGA
jgi:tetratricopeptide (TPR) repeat protein